MVVGVIIYTPNGLQAANEEMEYFAQRYGGLSAFEIQGTDNLERSLTDINGNKSIFNIISVVSGKGKVILIRDITENKIRDAHEHYVLRDALTNLPNRLLLYDRLQHAILVVHRENKPLSLLMLDIDGFKEINDNLGHNVGDELLKQVGKRLLSILRKSDTVARFGGDEFVVLLPAADIEQANQILRRLLDVLAPPFTIEGNSIYVGVSIGVVLCPDHGDDADTIIQLADAALQTAKQDQSGIVVYNPKHDQYSRSRVVLTGELRYAIEHEELVLNYQPKVDCKTGSVTGMEALVRWQHPKRGFIQPDEFITMAEQTGLIRPLTLWVLNTALSQCAEWHSSGFKIGVSVNMSTRNLIDQHFQYDVAERLKAWAVEPAWLEFEITESALMLDPPRAMEVLTSLDELGVKISIDDFGTGYSSLAYLKRMPVDEIKIDKSFVVNMAKDDHDVVIVLSIIELAHNLGLEVIAEGVEDQDIWDLLKKLGCDKVQGYHISVPLSATELTKWLSKSAS